MSDRIVVDGDMTLTSTIDGEGSAVIRLGQNPVIEPLNVTANGTYSVPESVGGFNPVTVAIPEYEGAYTVEPSTEEQTLATAGKVMAEDVTVKGIDNEILRQIMDRTIVNLDSDAITSLGRNALTYCTKLERVNLPNCTFVGQDGIGNCSALKEIFLENCTSLWDYAFSGCAGVRKYYLPRLISTGTTGTFTSVVCEYYVFPALAQIRQNAIRGNPKLIGIDMLGGGSLLANVTSNCPIMHILIFRSTKNVTTYNRPNDISTTQFGADGDGGTVYVPATMIDAYNANSGWQTIMGYNANNKILPIEGSIYETQYVDGTPIQ